MENNTSALKRVVPLGGLNKKVVFKHHAQKPLRQKVLNEGWVNNSLVE